MKMLGLLFLNAVILTLINADDDLVVTLPDGQIRGHVLRSAKNNDFYAFQEIPYATPPVGELRFQAPIAPQKWEGILNTTKNTKICYQGQFRFSTPELVETEDCLYLNVYTPQLPGNSSETLLPVLVYIPGGAFSAGSGTIQWYNPKYFLDYNVILVAINYRIGTLGFLTTEDGVIPGNIGLKDQHLALQWIKNNIQLFGGDPDKITIQGQSAGGTSVGLQVVSKRNEGLFRAAILQSGSALCQWSHQDHARFYAFELGRTLDPSFNSTDSKELLTLLQSLSASDIINNTITPAEGKETALVKGGGLIWLPVIENESLDGAFLTGPSHEEVKTGNINQVPILLGFTSEEYLSFASSDPSSVETIAKQWDDDVSSLIGTKFNMTQANKVIAGTKLREIYNEGSFQDDLGTVVKFLTDDMFTTPITRNAKLQSNYTDVFLYQFSYQARDAKDTGVAGVHGVGHGGESIFLWGKRGTNVADIDDPEDLLTRNRLLTMWTNFVKYLNPTPEIDNVLNNLRWEKVSPNNLVYLNISNRLEMKVNPKEYINWERIIDVYAIPPLYNY